MQIRSVRASSSPGTHPVSSRPQYVNTTALPVDITADTVRAGQVARRLGVTPLVVDQLRQSRRLLAIACAHGFAYPSWQFEGRGMLSGFPTVLNALRVQDPHSQLQFFLTPHACLDGKTPLDVLKSGDIEAVVQAAQS